MILVTERGAPGDQLRKLANSLEESLGLRPEVSDVPELIRVLYRLGREAAAGRDGLRLVELDELAPPRVP